MVEMDILPKFASTVILYRLKDRIDDLFKSKFEIFLIQRSKEMKFLGGVHAFPGGKLEQDDFSEKNLVKCKGLNKDQAYKLILDEKTYHKNKDYSLGFWIAGIREVFEEIGILFAYNKALNLLNLSNPKYKQKFENYREKLLRDEILFSDIVDKEELYLATDKLYYFRHFITPEISPIRYDTRFFLAELPPNQPIKPDTNEIISYEWTNPAEAIKQYRKKEIILIPPQYSCLLSLQRVIDIKEFCNLLS